MIRQLRLNNCRAVTAKSQTVAHRKAIVTVTDCLSCHLRLILIALQPVVVSFSTIQSHRRHNLIAKLKKVSLTVDAHSDLPAMLNIFVRNRQQNCLLRMCEYSSSRRLKCGMPTVSAIYFRILSRSK